MFERFTERARRTLFFARYESSQFGAPAIEPEHLLLGLVREGHGLISRVFGHWHLSLSEVRTRIEERIEHRPPISTSVEIPISARAQRALNLAQEEADRLEHKEIGSAHLLVGLLRTEDSLAATVMREAGMTVDTVREILTPPPEQPEMSISLEVASVSGLAHTVAQLQQEIAEVRERLDVLEREVRGRTGS